MPNKQYDKLVRGKDDDMNDVMYGNAIPARAPFKKWRKKIPLKWLSTPISIVFEKWRNRRKRFIMI